MIVRRTMFAALAAAIGSALVPVGSGAQGVGPDAIFERAKSVWRDRSDAAFVDFGLRERYTWRDRIHDTWWQIAYRSRDRAFSVRRTIVPQVEADRMRGVPIGLDLRFHGHLARADSLETNRDADAFPILDPQIAPDDSFGLVTREAKAALVGGEPASPVPGATDAPPSAARPLPSDEPTPAGDRPLRVLATVEATARDYRIALAGVERLRDGDAYHLTLEPLRDPRTYRLRDLWVDTATFETRQLAIAGLFAGEPYASARWLVTYVDVSGRPYVQEIRTDDDLRFGADRFVAGLQYDFVQYEFPALLPDLQFERYL